VSVAEGSMGRRPRARVGTSWKMTNNRAQATAYAERVRLTVDDLSSALGVFVLPPFPLVEQVAGSVPSRWSAWGSRGTFESPVGPPHSCERRFPVHSQMWPRGPRSGWPTNQSGRPATTDGRPNHSRRKRSTRSYQTLTDLLGDAGEAVPVLYGGSVTAHNAADFKSAPSIRGLFVGRAAWTVEGMLAVPSTVVGRPAPDECKEDDVSNRCRVAVGSDEARLEYKESILATLEAEPGVAEAVDVGMFAVGPGAKAYPSGGSAERSVLSNDGQVLTVGQRVIGAESARRLVRSGLVTPAIQGRPRGRRSLSSVPMSKPTEL
jgi:hypothetical protein